MCSDSTVFDLHLEVFFIGKSGRRQDIRALTFRDHITEGVMGRKYSSLGVQ
jgi:hypothetical protein